MKEGKKQDVFRRGFDVARNAAKIQGTKAQREKEDVNISGRVLSFFKIIEGTNND